MLYLIGGAARAGKTLLAQRMLIVEVEPAYTVEGDALSPKGVALLRAGYGPEIRACFIGYAFTTPARKLAGIRTFGGGVNDWIQHHSDQYILDLCAEMVTFSQFVREECNLYGIPYFDVSEDFLPVLERVYETLCAAGASKANGG